ncbi:MAG: ABC transporter permease subunit, partial [Romboutsia sp.]|uniref:ABC transporter permease subunit n=1 Tax=Romboutsia sp. TaxID=1965302 RepID=UPI003F3703DB
MSNKTKSMKKIDVANNTVVFSLISIVLGLLVGAIALIIAGINPIEAYGAMIEGIFGKPKFIAWTIIRSTPLILTGLSIAFAFRTGLFNIGAEGQFIIGALVATMV